MAIFLWGSRSCSFRVELQEFCMCFTQTQGYLFEHRVKMNTLFKRIFYFHITGDDCQRVPFGTWTLNPAPFISHACKTPPAFGGMKKCCSWEGEHSCVSGCALPGCFSMNNWAEECKWSLCRQPQAETQPFSPSGPTDVRHNVGTGCCISCIAKASPIYIYMYPFLPVLSCSFHPVPHLSLCVQYLYYLRKKSLQARGMTSISACAAGSYYSSLYEGKAL